MTRDAVVAEVVIASTMWLLISLAVILNLVKAPAWLAKVALGLLGAELVSVPITYGGGDFRGHSETAVQYVIPGLAVAFTMYAIAYGLRHHRRTTS